MLRSLVSLLIPDTYREQVLGDLQERGFRVRDILSILPSVWWSRLYRACTLPHFTMAGDLRPSLKSQARRSVLNATLFGFCLGILNGGVYREWSVRRMSVPLIAAIAGYALSLCELHFRMRKVSLARDGWRVYYSNQLAAELRQARLGGIQLLLLVTLIQVAQEIWPALNTGDLLIRTGYILTAYALAVLVNRPRVLILRKEIAARW